jgi:hypothetical protein
MQQQGGATMALTAFRNAADGSEAHINLKRVVAYQVEAPAGKAQKVTVHLEGGGVLNVLGGAAEQFVGTMQPPKGKRKSKTLRQLYDGAHKPKG